MHTLKRNMDSCLETISGSGKNMPLVEEHASLLLQHAQQFGLAAAVSMEALACRLVFVIGLVAGN